MTATIEEIKTYIGTPEGSLWFMNTVQTAIENKEIEKQREQFNRSGGYTHADLMRDQGNERRRLQEHENKAAIEVVVSQSRVREIIQTRGQHEYQAYLTDDINPRLEFYDHKSLCTPGDLKWISAMNDLDSICSGKPTRIHDRFVKPYYFDVVLTN